MYLSEVYGQGGIYAKVVAASIANGIPIWTIETCAPKFIDAEFEKHRMLSSNSSSSRAIPFNPSYTPDYLPFDLRVAQSGMQGDYQVDSDIGSNFVGWIEEKYQELIAGLFEYKEYIHKQHLNRYIEAWMLQKKVVTATEWDNFFNLRLAPDAQPEIQELARCMKEAMNNSGSLEKLSIGSWHAPYIKSWEHDSWSHIEVKKASVARCARVSYMNHDNSSPDIEKDIALHDMLLSAGHMTPFEHQATPMDDLYTDLDVDWQPGVTHQDRLNRQWSANFCGWIQHRQLL